MRSLLIGFLLGSLALPVIGEGKEILPPHEQIEGEAACLFCHNLSVLTPTGPNFNANCLGCHNQPGHAFGMPWSATDEAVPGVTGNSHNWSKPGLNPRYGAAIFKGWVDRYQWADGNLQCVVCHNPHQTSEGLKPETIHTSIPQGVGQPATGNAGGPAGTGQLTLTAPHGAGAEGFRVKIQSVTGGGGTFIISHEFAWKPNAWLNWNGSGWVAGTVDGPGRSFTNGATSTSDVPLDVSGVSVRWSAGANVGDYWDFYVGYPFLRMTDLGDAICIACHKERQMNHVRARGDDRYYRPNGVRKFSHPVGVGLNANGFDSDRATVLDADGTAVTDAEGKVGTSTSDGADGQGNATNDLVLEGGLVRCTTCHRAHNADSNSLSRDAR